MPQKTQDVDGDGFEEPLYRPENIDEAAKAADELGLSGGVHSVEVGGEDFFAPGDSADELDRVQRNAQNMTEEFGGMF